MKYRINAGGSTRLHITGRGKVDKIGAVRILREGILVSDAYYKFSGFETFFFCWEAGKDYELEIENMEISLAYRFNPDTVLERGVEFLEFGSRIQIYGKDEMKQAMAQNYRNQHHFSPYKNWMNDPNGLCWFQDYYHLFYQYNPNNQVWGNMHWGHAVSKDLIHWVHQPVAAYPQIELNGCEGYRGGAFSGSAVVENERLQLFYTRHFGKTDRTWQRQWQVRKESRDGVCFSHEECCIWGTPEGVTWHFRDPKVVKVDGVWNMILAGARNSRPCVFRYTSEDLKNWKYQGVLYQENDPVYAVAECPDFFYLDGKWILFVSYIFADGTRDGRDVRWYTGTFEQGKFCPEHQGLFDYGKDFYAPQSFEHDGRRISFGWNCCRAGAHIAEPGGANGSLSLPRVLSVKNGRIYAAAPPELELLLSEYSKPGPYYLRLEKKVSENGAGAANADEEMLEVILVQSGQEILSLQVKGSDIRLCQKAKSKETECRIPFECRFGAHTEVKTLELYIDRAIAELFVNNGEDLCTRRFYMKDAYLEPVIVRGEGWTDYRKQIASIW